MFSFSQMTLRRGICPFAHFSSIPQPGRVFVVSFRRSSQSGSQPHTKGTPQPRLPLRFSGEARCDAPFLARYLSALYFLLDIFPSVPEARSYLICRQGLEQDCGQSCHMSLCFLFAPITSILPYCLFCSFLFLFLISLLLSFHLILILCFSSSLFSFSLSISAINHLFL